MSVKLHWVDLTLARECATLVIMTTQLKDLQGPWLSPWNPVVPRFGFVWTEFGWFGMHLSSRFRNFGRFVRMYGVAQVKAQISRKSTQKMQKRSSTSRTICMCSKLRTVRIIKHYLGIIVLWGCRELFQYVKNKMDLNLGDERRKGGQRESKKKLMRFEPTIFSTAMLIYYIGTGYWTNSSDSRTGWTAAQQPFVRTANGLVWPSDPNFVRVGNHVP